MRNRSFPHVLALGICLLFVLTGALWIAQPGLQTDEALFAAGIYGPFDPQYVVHLSGRAVPLMVMSYVGAAKAWVWTAVFAVWPPSPASVRLPALLLGAITVWLFYRLLLRTLGMRVALTGCSLLATDTMFLLTTRLDWGPVAVQHFCLVGSLLAFVRFHQRQRSTPLAVGFFLLGLGMWDKALLVWSVVGLCAAACTVFSRELRKAVTPRNVGIAAFGFVAGASPLILYNLQHGFTTFGSNTAWSCEIFGYKVHMLRATWEGSALLGAIPREAEDGHSLPADSRGKQLLFALNAAAGSPRKNLLLPAFFICLGLLPVVWRTSAQRAALFALVFSTVTFLMMAFTKNAGASAHHSVLVWPLPHMFLAAVLVEATRSRRFGDLGSWLIVAALCVSNLLLTSTYYTKLLRNGGTPGWTDAVYALSASLRSMQVNRVCLLDWGFADNLRLLHEGRLPLCVATDLATDNDRDVVRRLLAEDGNVFVGHTSSDEINIGARKRFTEFLLHTGYRKSGIQTFSDSRGRPVIELFSVQTAAD